jgi:hypothetical protein
MRTVGDAEELERTVGDAVAAQDHHPGVGPQEQAGPKRDHNHEYQGGPAPTTLEGNEVRQGVAQSQAQEGVDERYDERADDDLQVQRVEDLEVVARVEAERYPTVDAAGPERVRQDKEQRHQEEEP